MHKVSFYIPHEQTVHEDIWNTLEVNRIIILDLFLSRLASSKKIFFHRKNLVHETNFEIKGRGGGVGLIQKEETYVLGELQK